MQHHPHSLTAWLWWLAILIAIIGAAVAYMLRMNVINERALAWSNLAIAATVSLAGVCVISATSGWWMRR